MLAEDATDVNMVSYKLGISSFCLLKMLPMSIWPPTSWESHCVAVRRGHIELVEVYLGRCDLDVNAADCLGLTALLTAAYGDRVGILRVLIGSPMNVDIDCKAGDEFGWTLLHMAADKGNCDIATLLLPNIEDINVRSNYGSTALHCASQRRYIDVVRVLLKHSNIDVNASNSNRHTPLHRASHKGHDNVVAALLVYQSTSVKSSISEFATDLERAKVNAVNKYGNTPLHGACKTNRIDVERTLLSSESIDIDTWRNPSRFGAHERTYCDCGAAGCYVLRATITVGQRQIVLLN